MTPEFEINSALAALKGYQQRYSKINFSDRRLETIVNAIILHYTAGGNWLGAYRWFAEYPQSKSSATFIHGRFGESVHVVPLIKKAWHAGNSCMLSPDRKKIDWDVNEFSYGHEIANVGYLERHDDGTFWYEAGSTIVQYQTGPGKYPPPVLAELQYQVPSSQYSNGLSYKGWWEPYTVATFESVVAVCEILMRQSPAITLDRIVGHESVNVPIGRKRDPGPMWPWKEFYRRLGATAADIAGDALWRNHKTNVRQLDPQLAV